MNETEKAASYFIRIPVVPVPLSSLNLYAHIQHHRYWAAMQLAVAGKIEMSRWRPPRAAPDIWPRVLCFYRAKCTCDMAGTSGGTRREAFHIIRAVKVQEGAVCRCGEWQLAWRCKCEVICRAIRARKAMGFLGQRAYRGSSCTQHMCRSTCHSPISHPHVSCRTLAGPERNPRGKPVQFRRGWCLMWVGEGCFGLLVHVCHLALSHHEHRCQATHLRIPSHFIAEDGRG